MSSKDLGMSDKKIVYVVSADYGYEGVETQGMFSTRELAEEAMSLRPDRPYTEIEECELDDMSNFRVEEKVEEEVAEIPSRRVFRAIVSIIYNEIVTKSELDVRTDAAFNDGCVVTLRVHKPGRRDYVEVDSIVSMDHAVEVAQAARLRFIKDNEGKLDYDPDWHLKNRFSE